MGGDGDGELEWALLESHVSAWIRASVPAQLLGADGPQGGFVSGPGVGELRFCGRNGVAWREQNALRRPTRGRLSEASPAVRVRNCVGSV